MNKISIEKIAAYIDGNLSSKEMRDTFMQINGNEEIEDIMYMNQVLDKELEYSISDNDFQDIGSIEELNLPNIDSFAEEMYPDIFLMDTESISFGRLTEDDIIQKYPDTCAIKSQQIIMESHGINISEDELLDESIEKGWYEPGKGGTSASDVGNLLEDRGFEVQKLVNCSIDDIANELAQGHQIIVGVDSGELWSPSKWESIEDFFHWKGADHALIVSGIQVNPLTAQREVILTDPGTGEVAKIYSVEQFEDAWDDSDNFMVVSQI